MDQHDKDVQLARLAAGIADPESFAQGATYARRELAERLHKLSTDDLFRELYLLRTAGDVR